MRRKIILESLSDPIWPSPLRVGLPSSTRVRPTRKGVSQPFRSLMRRSPRGAGCFSFAGTRDSTIARSHSFRKHMGRSMPLRNHRPPPRPERWRERTIVEARNHSFLAHLPDGYPFLGKLVSLTERSIREIIAKL